MSNEKNLRLVTDPSMATTKKVKIILENSEFSGVLNALNQAGLTTGTFTVGKATITLSKGCASISKSGQTLEFPADQLEDIRLPIGAAALRGEMAPMTIAETHFSMDENGALVMSRNHEPALPKPARKKRMGRQAKDASGVKTGADKDSEQKAYCRKHAGPVAKAIVAFANGHAHEIGIRMEDDYLEEVDGQKPEPTVRELRCGVLSVEVEFHAWNMKAVGPALMKAFACEDNPLQIIPKMPGRWYFDRNFTFAARQGNERFILMVPKVFTSDIGVLTLVGNILREERKAKLQEQKRLGAVLRADRAKVQAEWQAKMAEGMEWGEKHLMETFKSGKGAIEVNQETVKGLEPYTLPWFAAIIDLHNGICCECGDKKSKTVTMIGSLTWVHCMYHGQASRKVVEEIRRQTAKKQEAEQEAQRLQLVEILRENPWAILRKTPGGHALFPLTDCLSRKFPQQRTPWVDIDAMAPKGTVEPDPFTGEPIHTTRGFLIYISPALSGREAEDDSSYLPVSAFTAELIMEHDVKLPLGMYLVRKSEVVAFVEKYFRE